ncbi:MAG: class I SAM-dependent methyltransferase [Anaerolineaceae bacterium]|nr:MAG: class I SAM-dependent methyltransferase [Anaerolineaceae bacterium]
MPHPDALRWDERYSRETERFALRAPRHLLTSHLDLLPPNGLILDAACGTTSTGRYLAAHGWRVIALDVSNAALRLARQKVKKDASPVSFAVMDMVNPWLPESHFDVILNFYFLSRPIIPTYRQALKPGGLLFFETYLREPHANAERYLESQELRRFFDDWDILHYIEVERLVRARSGYEESRWTAQLIARKPK